MADCKCKGDGCLDCWLELQLSKPDMTVTKLDRKINEALDRVIVSLEDRVAKARSLKKFDEIKFDQFDVVAAGPVPIFGGAGQDTISFGGDLDEHSPYWYDRNRNR